MIFPLRFAANTDMTTKPSDRRNDCPRQQGWERKKFTAPRGFLIKSSEFLRKYCNGHWQEVSTRTVKLPEMDPNAFEIYHHWLLTGELTLINEYDPCKAKASSTEEMRRLSFALYKAMTTFDHSCGRTHGSKVR